GEELREEGVGIRGPIKGRELERWIEPKYPAWAQKQGIEGKVEVKCLVLPNGVVRSVETVLSSGWPELDEYACQVLMKWKFGPIKEEEIQWGIVPFEFELE
ncbi:energy transducer TonB, partial [Candidatus Aerophobetes bacterium]